MCAGERQQTAGLCARCWDAPSSGILSRAAGVRRAQRQVAGAPLQGPSSRAQEDFPSQRFIDLDRRLNDQIWLPERAKLNCASTRIRKRPPVQVSAVESMNYNRCDQATNK